RRYSFFLAVWIRKLRYSFSLPITAWNNWTDLPIQLPHCLDAHIQRCAFPIRLRLPITRTVTRWCRNIHLLTIAYAFRPRLRSRLTLSGRAFLGNLRLSVKEILTLFSLLIPAFSLPDAPPVLTVWLPSGWNALLPLF